MTSYWRSIATMALSHVVYEILTLNNIATLKSRSRVNQGHPIDWLWFDAQFLRYSTCKYIVTSKPGLGVTQGHRHPYFAPPLKGFPLELGIWGGVKKLEWTRMMWLLGRIRSWTISSAVWIQCTDVADGRTDGRTPGGWQQRPRLRIASCGKNQIKLLQCITKVNKKLSWCWQTRTTRLEVSHGHQTWYQVRYGFLLVCYSNFVRRHTVFEIYDFKNAMTLTTG